ncbi:MAG TPA: hypothetical protein VFF68_10405, partial [Anaerolineaceae bacterium]|nr:hypothetical protein [Anaerolineaceae bacterium]
LLVIDAGNQFNAYRVARQLRRQTIELDAALERIRLVRPFTVYQLIALFDDVRPPAPIPVIILDLLMLFYDEDVALSEAQRLLARTLAHLTARKQAAPVLVGARPPNRLVPERLVLLHALAEASDLFLQPSGQAERGPGGLANHLPAAAVPLLPGIFEE